MITPACTRAIPRLPRAGAEATISARQAERSAGRTSGRNPSFTREQFGRVGSILGSRPRTSLIAKETGLTRQTICRIKGDLAGAAGLWAVWDTEALFSGAANARSRADVTGTKRKTSLALSR